MTMFRAPMLLVFALLSTAACKSRQPVPVRDDLLAANAAAYMLFGGDLDMSRWNRSASAEVARGLQKALPELIGLDPFDATTRATLGADDARPIVVSWAVADAGQIQQLLDHPEPPEPGTPVGVRTEMTMPVVDARAAGKALGGIRLSPECRRPGDVYGTAVDYACQFELAAVTARVDADHRELRWSVAMGFNWTPRHTLHPLPRSPALTRQLARDGFFTAGLGYFARPGDAALGYATLTWLRTFAMIDGVEPELRRQLWTKGAKEFKDFTTAVQSPPRLFDSYQRQDDRHIWTLTAKGKALFGSGEMSKAKTPEQLNAAVAAQLQPGGSFASESDLNWTVRVLGSNGPLLVHDFLWPHVLAYAAKHGGTSPFGSTAKLGGEDTDRWQMNGSQLVIEFD